MTKLQGATKAQVDALHWLMDQGWTENISGSGFGENYYTEKSGAPRPSLGRCRGYWRAGGRMLTLLKRAGLVEQQADEELRHSPLYRITDLGLRVSEESP